MSQQFKIKGLSRWKQSLTDVFNMFIWNEYLRQNDLKGKRWTHPKKHGGD